MGIVLNISIALDENFLNCVLCLTFITKKVGAVEIDLFLIVRNDSSVSLYVPLLNLKDNLLYM